MFFSELDVGSKGDRVYFNFGICGDAYGSSRFADGGPVLTLPVISDFMECPACGGKSKVVDSRKIASIVRRRRECRECGHRFATTERARPLVGSRDRAEAQKGLGHSSK